MEVGDDQNKENMRKETIAFDVATNDFPEKRFSEKYIFQMKRGMN